MILNTATIAYLFDFDGTLVGSDEWHGIWHNTKVLFQNPPYINPDKLDIRWFILTARPKVDYCLIKFICGWYGLHPSGIYTSGTFRYKFKNTEEEMSYKRQFIVDILNGDIKLPQYKHNIEKVLYIDNNTKAIEILNSNRNSLNYLAMTVNDFYTDKFHYIL